MATKRGQLFNINKTTKDFSRISKNATDLIETQLFDRFTRLGKVSRFIFIWLTAVILVILFSVFQSLNLNKYYQTNKYVAGGIYTEGVQGVYTDSDPLFATNIANQVVSKLIYASLFNVNSQGQLVGDLAKSYSVNSTGNEYTVNLKPNLVWQDGKPLTSADVLYTYNTIQNPNTGSPFQSSWTGIKVAAPNALTITFTLPDPLASFPYSLTNGIVPEHILSSISPQNIRSSNFSSIDPIGAGPFQIQAVSASTDSNSDNTEDQIALVPFAKFNGGKPKVDHFIVDVYSSQNDLISALKNGNITASASLSSTPNGLSSNFIEHNYILRAANMVFFKTDETGPLSDSKVRNALVEAVDVPKIISTLGYSTPEVIEPLLQNQLAFNNSYAQSSYSPSSAKSILTADGYSLNTSGQMIKNGQPLAFVLTIDNNPENIDVASQLVKYWKNIGAKVTVESLDALDFKTASSEHNYDALLNGISIGVDPDVFVYWDSSEADIRSTGLNYSDYSNPSADESLEEGRTRINSALRVIKYETFLQDWQADSPALGLYQPRILYITNGHVNNLSSGQINSTSDIYNNVQNWEIRKSWVTDKR